MAVTLPIDLSRTYTAEEFAALPEDNQRWELVDGRVVAMTWPHRGTHGSVNSSAMCLPRARTITIHAPRAEPTVLSESDTLGGGEIIPGFHYPVAPLFADPT